MFEKIIKIYIVPFIGYLFLRVLRLFILIDIVNEEYPKNIWNNDKNMIIAFWHGRQLMTPFVYKGVKPYVLISMHTDGEIISRLLSLFNFGSVRGSSSRQGAKALRELIRLGRGGNDLVVTPDGPRGPRHSLQMGTIVLAQKTGLPIVPLSFGSTKKKVMGSWDKFEMPLPFSKGVFVWGEPIYVENSKNPKYLKEIQQKIEKSLNEVTNKSDAYYKKVY